LKELGERGRVQKERGGARLHRRGDLGKKEVVESRSKVETGVNLEKIQKTSWWEVEHDVKRDKTQHDIPGSGVGSQVSGEETRQKKKRCAKPKVVYTTMFHKKDRHGNTWL